MNRAFARQLPLRVITVGLVGLSSACGWIGLGQSYGPRDPVPTGTLVAQGTFSSVLTGKNVSGGVTVYQTNGQSYIVRLEGLTAPAEAGLQLRVLADSAALTNVALRSTIGTMNYPYTAGSTARFQTVYIYSAPNNLDYGRAELIKAP